MFVLFTHKLSCSPANHENLKLQLFTDIRALKCQELEIDWKTKVLHLSFIGVTVMLEIPHLTFSALLDLPC